MTALLTPVETIFDDLTIMGLEKHWDDDVMCEGIGCERPACLRLKMRCCPRSATSCVPCLLITHTRWEQWLQDGCVTCVCGAVYRPPQTVADIAEVGDL